MTDELSTVAKLKQNQYLVPVSILIGFGMVAGSIVFSSGIISSLKQDTRNMPTPTNLQKEPTGSTDKVSPVTSQDHIKGSPDALVKIVEYSDYECPFCKQFHDTMNAVIKKYEGTKDVAWVYRHFPLEQLHPKNAMKVAVASECAVEQGGNDMFWKFSDLWFELTPTNDRTDLTVVLPQIYSEIGLNKIKMDECMISGRYDEHIQADFENAVATGGEGTPWSVVILQDGRTMSLNGAQTIQSVEALIVNAKK